MRAPAFSWARLRATSAALRNGLRQPHPRALVGTAGLNVATVVVGSMGGLLLARVLGPTARGDLVTVLLWPATIGAVMTFGLHDATCYWISRNPDHTGATLITAITAALITGLLVAAVGPWVAPHIGRNSAVTRDITFILALTPAYIASGVLISALQAVSIPKMNAVRATQPVIYLLTILCFWAVRRLTLTTAISAYGISLIAQTLIAALVAGQVIGYHHRPKASLLGPLYAYGSKVWLSSVPQLVNVSVDQLMLSIMPGVARAQLGNYAVAVSLSWLALPASVAFGSVAFPRIARTSNDIEARRIERFSLVGAGGASALAIGAVSLAAPFVVPAVFGKGYEDAIVPLWLLAPGTVFLALNRVLGDLLQGRGHPLVRSGGEAIGAPLTIVLLLSLIPPLGIRGAAIASSIAYGVVCLFLWSGLRRSSLPAEGEVDPEIGRVEAVTGTAE